MIKLFGIRHHGVGSTKRLQKALAQYQPDILVIEGIAEADNLIQYLREDLDKFTPPIAMLIYDTNDFGNAVYYPFAAYSPEWQAMKYAVQNSIPIVHFDLPLQQSLALKTIIPNVEKIPALVALEEDLAAENNIINSSTEGAPYSLSQKEKKTQDIDSFHYDPMTYMAKLAGYEETEHWWDSMFEQYEDEAVFDGVAEVMESIRTHLGEAYERPIDLYREAYMRQQLRKIEKEGFQKIAVICGAYHIPALALKKYTIKDDQQLLKIIPKTKINLQSTWIPWSFKNLSAHTYGAGIPAPAWYQFLYENTENATTHWMANVADLLRKNDVDCSSAHIIEAVKLALYLTQMRGLNRPTLSELNEAAISVLLNGQTQKLSLVINQLEIGNKMGIVAPSVPQVPLQKDIETLIKNLKLTKYQKPEKAYIKATANNTYGGLDLRLEHDRMQSQFLHRLYTLDIHWGTPTLQYVQHKSTKNEYWSMQWQEGFYLRIIQASIYGNTLEEAATAFSIQRTNKTNKLALLTEQFTQILKANLPTAFSAILQKIETLSAVQTDVLDLMGMIPNLVQTARYGDVRKTDTSLVEKLITETVPRICVLLPSSCIGINDESAIKLAEKIKLLHNALLLFQQEQLIENWFAVLQSLSEKTHPAHAYIKGLCTRMIFDNQNISAEETSLLMQFALSKGQVIQEAAPWVEGFLYNSGLFLLHNEVLWNILNNWIAELDKETFITIVPILRRAFSKFSHSEKQKMLTKSSQSKTNIPICREEKIYIHTRMDLLKPFLKKMLNTVATSHQN